MKKLIIVLFVTMLAGCAGSSSLIGKVSNKKIGVFVGASNKMCHFTVDNQMQKMLSQKYYDVNMDVEAMLRDGIINGVDATNNESVELNEEDALVRKLFNPPENSLRKPAIEDIVALGKARDIDYLILAGTSRSERDKEEEGIGCFFLLQSFVGSNSLLVPTGTYLNVAVVNVYDAKTGQYVGVTSYKKENLKEFKPKLLTKLSESEILYLYNAAKKVSSKGTITFLNGGWRP